MDSESSSWPPVEGASDGAPTILDTDRFTLGQMLRFAREQRALTLEQVSELTHIQLSHLQAYEHDDLAGTAPGMYQRAEIRAIADAVGLDTRTALIAVARPAEQPRGLAAVLHDDVPAGLRDGTALLAYPEERPLAMPMAAAPAPLSSRGGVTVGILTVALIVLAWLTFRAPANAVPQEPPRATASRELPTTTQDVAATSPAPAPVPPTVSAPEPVSVPASLPTSSPAATSVQPRATDAPAEPTITQTDHAPAAPVSPTLHVITDPAGARVTINGIGWGEAPLTIPYLPPGEKRIRVTYEGYRSRERVVAIDPDGAETVVRIALRRRR